MSLDRKWWPHAVMSSVNQSCGFWQHYHTHTHTQCVHLLTRGQSWGKDTCIINNAVCDEGIAARRGRWSGDLSWMEDEQYRESDRKGTNLFSELCFLESAVYQAQRHLRDEYVSQSDAVMKVMPAVQTVCVCTGAVRASSIFPILSVILLFMGGLCVAASEFQKSRHNIILSAGIFFVSAGEWVLTNFLLVPSHTESEAACDG